jgi:hypothetical protein
VLGGLSSVITEPMEGAYNDGLAGFFKGQMVHPQDVQLHNVQLQNIQLQNSQLPNIQLSNAQLQNVKDYKTSWIQNVHLPKRPGYKTSIYQTPRPFRIQNVHLPNAQLQNIQDIDLPYRYTLYRAGSGLGEGKIFKLLK